MYIPIISEGMPGDKCFLEKTFCVSSSFYLRSFALQFSSFLLLLHIVKEYLYDYECI